MVIKIGLLTPHSNFIPFLAGDFPRALEAGLTENGQIDYELYVEPTGYNSDKKILAEKIQNLIIKQQVDVVIAPLNVGLFDQVRVFFNSNQVPLIINSMGEDVIFNHSQDPYLFINSFNLWQASWMAGYWGAQKYGKDACSSIALHDGGYGMGFAFALGLEAQGGQLLQTVVTHRESSTEDPTEFLQMIIKRNPSFIFGLYSGKEARSFLEAYGRTETQIPLVGLPPMFAGEPDISGEPPFKIKTITSWDQNSAENHNFETALSTQTEHPTNFYTLLAYETGQLISRAVEEIGPDKPILKHLPEALKAVKFNGPRGVIKFDPETRETNSKNYLQEVTSAGAGKFHHKTITELEIPALFQEQLGHARKNLSKTGWLNPYLIA